MAFARALIPAQRRFGAAFRKLIVQRTHARSVGAEFLGAGVDTGFDRQ
jgi:hypothetical protein